MSQQVTENDWRLQGQEAFLFGVTLYWRTWRETRPGWDHDHCEFCRSKFMDRDDVQDILRDGYTTEGDYRWVCAFCASDFANRLKFKLIDGPAGSK
jgi:hypothetical protein